MNQSRYRDHVTVLFVAGLLLFNYPLLALVDQALLILGVPLLYGYIFLAWLGLIAATALLVRSAESQSSADENV